MYYALILFVFLTLFSVFLIFKFSRGKKLDLKSKNDLKNNFLKITKLDSKKEQIVDFDKLLHKILLGLKYKGTFWEILKSKPKIISDIDSVWEVHKLRNKLVHDFDDFSDSFLTKKALQYKKILLELLDRI
jgi:hypothetical protein